MSKHFHSDFSPTGVPRPSGIASQVSGSSFLGVDDGGHRPRLHSSYLRELTRGRFIIKYEEITLLESIGQGIYVLYTCICVGTYICT